MTSAYWDWDYHVSRKWIMPPDVTASELWVAHVMATFGSEGRGIAPSAESLAKRANLRVRQTKALRKRAIHHGLFAERVPTEYQHGIPVLDVAIPPDYETVHHSAPVQESTPKGAVQCTPPVQYSAPDSSNSSYYSEGAPLAAPDSSPVNWDQLIADHNAKTKTCICEPPFTRVGCPVHSPQQHKPVKMGKDYQG